MKASFNLNNKNVKVDLSKPLDLSIPLNFKKSNITAWGQKSASRNPVQIDNWIGDCNQGSSVNFFDITFNPHSHVTHTECLGHISKGHESVNTLIRNYFFICRLISVDLLTQNGDLVISKKALQELLCHKPLLGDALIVRTMPNNDIEKHKDYTGTNPPYFENSAITYLRDMGVNHLLVDIPSLDKEDDGGGVQNHKIFWDYLNKKREHCSITELIYVQSAIKDGDYLLNLQIAPFENDASPSRPILFNLIS